MSRRDGYIVVSAIALAAALFLLSAFLPGDTGSPAAPEIEGLSVACVWAGVAPGADAESYLKIQFQGKSALIPLSRAGTITLTQENGAQNTVRVGENKFFMQRASCSGQDCVKQGEVTPYNRNARALTGFVICLPNQITLDLLTAKEARENGA